MIDSNPCGLAGVELPPMLRWRSHVREVVWRGGCRGRSKRDLDDYQVRRYDAWHRHITLAMLAHAPKHVRPGRPHTSRDPRSPGTPDPRHHPTPRARPRLVKL